uniref:Ran gtpase-activating protein n=1 Tax=Amblyomma triste TaxID=251400 RepID=A0A023G927_AMBTT
MSTTMKRKRPQKDQVDQEMRTPTNERSLKTYFRHFDLDVRKPCTHTNFSETVNGAGPSKRQHGCWLIRRVDIWNRFFENIGIELRQSQPGKLSVSTFAPQSDPSLTDYGLVCATLLGELLAIHRCIYYVHCGYSGHLFALKRRMVDHLVPNAALEQFHLDGQMMARDEAYGLIRTMVRGNLLGIQISNLQLRHCDLPMLSDYVESTASLKEVVLVHVGLKVVDIVALFKSLECSKTVELIRLESNTVGIRGAQQFAKLLKRNKVLRSATLQRARLQSKGAMAIASALTENTTLTALRIASNGIGATGTRALADALKLNNSLTVLDLRDNAIGAEGARAVAEMLTVSTKLEELHVCGNAISDSGIVAVAESLMHNKTLKILSVFANGFGENGVAALARLLASNETLQRLNATLESTFGGRRPLDAFADALASNKTLRGMQLFVWGSHAMRQLSHTIRLTETLQYLCVCTSGPEIEQLCCALEKNQSIQEVEINCYLNIEGGVALARLFEATTTIRAVTITKRVTTTCLIRMFQGLAKNKSIWWFSVQCGFLRMSACTAIAAALEVNRTLYYVTFGRPSVDEASMKVLCAGIANNPVVQMVGLGYTTSSRAAFKIRERLRRNTHLMMQAIEFVLAHTISKLGAAAFEMHKESTFFRQELGKAGESRGRESSALALIREAELFIEDNYFLITGVVKEEIVCVRPKRKRKKVAMFDVLNRDCLKEVLSYLRVSDVI